MVLYMSGSNLKPQTEKRLYYFFLFFFFGLCLASLLPYLTDLAFLRFIDFFRRRRKIIGQRAVADLSEYLVEELVCVGIEVLTGPAETESLKLSECESMLFFSFPEPPATPTSVNNEDYEDACHSKVSEPCGRAGAKLRAGTLCVS